MVLVEVLEKCIHAITHWWRNASTFSAFIPRNEESYWRTAKDWDATPFGHGAHRIVTASSLTSSRPDSGLWMNDSELTLNSVILEFGTIWENK